MQTKKAGKLLYIESESEEQKEQVKKQSETNANSQQNLKYGSYKAESFKIQKNMIKSTGFEQDYVYSQQKNTQKQSKPIQYIGQNYFNLENHTIHTINNQENRVETLSNCQISMLEKLEAIKDKENDNSNPEADQLRRTTKSKKNILEANFDSDSEEQAQAKVQVQNEENENISSKNQHDGIIQQTKWDASVSRQLFAFHRVKQSQRLYMVLQRQSSGLNFFAPQFDLMFGNDPRIILSCKKKISTNLQCIISLDKNDLQQKSPHCIGKVIGNFKNNIFHLIDIRKKSIVCTTRFREQENITIATPKNYEIFLLNQNCRYTDLIGCDPENYDKGLDQLYLIPVNKKYISYFRNKKPQFCKEIGAYMLNFSGRVKQGSVKNFIIEDSKSGREMLMFGKSFNEAFNLYISGPLSPFIALGIVIPHFTTKVLFK